MPKKIDKEKKEELGGNMKNTETSTESDTDVLEEDEDIIEEEDEEIGW